MKNKFKIGDYIFDTLNDKKNYGDIGIIVEISKDFYSIRWIKIFGDMVDKGKRITRHSISYPSDRYKVITEDEYYMEML